MGFLANATKATVRIASTVGFKVKKYSPEILLGTGLICVVGGVVVACKQTQKAQEIMEAAAAEKRVIEAELADQCNDYTEEQAANDLALVKKSTTKALVKTYAPVVGIELLGIACIGGSYGILKKRNVALLAAYEVLDDRFRKYRERAKQALGEDAENDIYRGLKHTDETPDMEVLDKDGNTIGSVPGKELEGYGPYAMMFDEVNAPSVWVKDPFANKNRIVTVRNWSQNYLDAHGYLFLNQVREWLGMQPIPEGQAVGWLSAKKGGSGYVDFGEQDTWRKTVYDFQHGYERSILLDPNVDGVIWDKI